MGKIKLCCNDLYIHINNAVYLISASWKDIYSLKLPIFLIDQNNTETSNFIQIKMLIFQILNHMEQS
jgi:hypothetical protein